MGRVLAAWQLSQAIIAAPACALWCSKRRPALVPPLHQLEEGAGIIVAVESEPCRQLRWQQTADSKRRQAEVQVASRAAGGGGCMRRPLGQRQ